MRSKLDQIWIGLLAGLLIPILIVYGVYLFKYSAAFSFEEILEKVYNMGVLFKVFSIGVFVGNLSLFYLCYKLMMNKACRGIIMATFLYTITVIIYKFV